MKFVSITEAAKLSGKSTKTIRQWIKTGHIKGAIMEQSKHGARYMIPVEALDTNHERTVETLPAPYNPASTVKALEIRLEATLLSLEARLLESIDARLEARLEARDKLLLEAIRTRQEEKRPWWRRLISKD